MHDNEFDKHIKAALEKFTDSTPVEEGWQRFTALNAGVPVATASTRWLKLSVGLNILLVGMIAWLVWQVDSLDSRIDDFLSKKQDQAVGSDAPERTDLLESFEQTTAVKDEAPERPLKVRVDNMKDGYPAPVFERKNQGNAQRLSSVSNGAVTGRTNTMAEEIAPSSAKADGTENKSENSDGAPSSLHSPTDEHTESHVPADTLLAEERNSFLPIPEHDVRAAEASESEVGQEGTVVEQKKTKAPLKTIVAIEKNKLGRKIDWGYGATGNFGASYPGKNYSGIHAGGGIGVEAILHPVWGLETGVYIQHYRLESEDNVVMTRIWEQATVEAPAAPLDDLESVVYALEAPLLLKFRLPLSTRTTGYVSGGMVYSYALSKRQTFELDYPDELEDTAGDTKESFSSKPSTFYWGWMGEAGLNRKINRSLQVRAAVYYKNHAKNSDGFAGILLGIKAGLTF